MSEKVTRDMIRYYKEMVKTFPCAAFVSLDDRENRTIEVLCANREYYDLTGITPDAIEFGDHDITNLDDIATEDKLRVNKEFGDAARERRTVAMDAQIRRIDGTYMRCRIHARPLDVVDGATVFVVTFHRYDDKDPEKIIKKHYVEHDALTNIFNLKGFCQQTAEVLATYPERRFTIVVSDIDSFKTINNMFGDEVGDDILRRIAERIREHFKNLFRNRIPGSYGRIGSDRFAVCLPSEILDPNRLCTWADAQVASFDLNYRILTHFGFCEVPDKEANVADIVEQAYLACSTVKHNLRVRYAYYDSDLRKTLLEEQELIAQAERALKRGEFVPYYQPVYLADARTLISAEALVRWQHPKRGLLAPGAFVPVMERNGFITQLDAAIWEAVLRFLHERLSSGAKVVPISVNMSRQDICNPKLSEELSALLRKYEVDPAYLHIEVTESAYIDEGMQNQLSETIRDLRDKGFIILMDDFGSGYSSLNVLKDMPVDIMKIDRGLTMDIENSERGKTMLSTIVRLANRLYIPTIAEGVENESQYRFLKGIGCDSIQGYYFSKPISQDAFAELLDASEVPAYEPGESIPGHFALRDRDQRPHRDTVLFLGEGGEEAKEFLRHEYLVRAVGDAQEAISLAGNESEPCAYVMMTREAFVNLIRDGSDGS